LGAPKAPKKPGKGSKRRENAQFEGWNMRGSRVEGTERGKRRVRGKVGFYMVMILLLQLGRKDKGSEWKSENERGKERGRK
jgi:hypothetical protein